MNKRIKLIISLGIIILLCLSLTTPNIWNKLLMPSAQAVMEPLGDLPEPEAYWSSRNSKQIDNDDGTHTTTFHIGPQVFWNGTNWQELNFEDHYASDGYYLIENSHITAKIYDWYTVFYDSDNNYVCVDDERWIVEYWWNDKEWREVDLYNPTLSYSNNDTHLTVTRTFDCPNGLFNITYILWTASRLKHDVEFKSRMEGDNIFQVIMKLSGITNNKVKYKDGEERITTEKHIISPFIFIGEDNNHLKLTEYLWSLGVTPEELDGEWTPTTLKDIVFDTHAKGCKVDIIIGDYTLAENENLLIDPTTDTFYSGVGDGHVERAFSEPWNNVHDATSGSGSNDVGITFNVASRDGYTIIRCFIPFNTSSIPDDATIQSAYLNLSCSYVSSSNNVGTRSFALVQTSQASTSSLVLGDYSKCGAIDNPTEGANRVTITTTGWKEWTLNANGLSWINKTGWTKLGIRTGWLDCDDVSPIDDVQEGYVSFETSESDNDPKLEVIWEVGVANNAPIQTNQCIWNATTKVEKSLNATAVDLYPTSFNVTINDTDGDKMNITIKTNESGSWTVVNQTSGTGLSNGTYNFTNTSWIDDYSTTYYVSFNVTDGVDWCNETYNFTTTSAPWSNTAPTLTNEVPANTSTGISRWTQLNVTVTDADGNNSNVYWYTNASGDWYLLQTNTSILNTTVRFMNFTNASSYSTMYWWRVSANDTHDNTTETYHFTTKAVPSNQPPTITGEIPTNQSTGISITPQLSINVSDPDGDNMNITWYGVNSTAIEFFNESTTVGETDTAYSIWMSIQRQIFYANGRFWVFYAINESVAVYRTSTNGSTWSSPITIKTGLSFGVADMTFWFDGTYLHYAADNNNIAYYRQGIPNSDGSITWSADEQLVAAPVDAVTSLCTDSEDYPWITYITPSPYKEYVIKSSTKDGTWVNETGFPYLLKGTTQYPVIVPLNNEKVYVVFAYSGTKLYGRLWNGTGWGDEETVSSSNSYAGNSFSAVAYGDDVHVTFLKETDYDILHIKRTYGSGWGSEITVQSSVTGNSYPQLSVDDNGKLYCFWMGSPETDHGYFKKYTDGSWDTNPTDWINESTNQLYQYYSDMCSYKADNGYISYIYLTNYTAPYNVTFAYINTEYSYIFGTNNSVSNGTYYQTNSNFSAYSTTYYWNVSVYDGTNTNSSGLFHFTTEAAPTTVEIAPITYAWGSNAMGSDINTTGLYFTLWHNGSNVDIYIQVNDSAHWTYVDYGDLDAHDEFTMNFTTDNWASQTNIVAAGTTKLFTNHAAGSETFGLRILMPATTNNPLTEQSWKVYIHHTVL